MVASNKFTFLWADANQKEPINLSAPEYINNLFQWIDQYLSKFCEMPRMYIYIYFFC